MASSLRKIKSARANGAKSHGPVTPEGRQTSSLNALRHGFAAQTVVLTTESTASFQQVFQAYLDHFQPLGDIEVDFVEEMAVAKWHQRRAWAIQTATLEYRMDLQDAELKARFDPVRESTRLAIAFSTEANASKTLPLLLRYEGTHRRTYDKAFQGLLKVQAKRKQAGVEHELQNEPNPTNEQRNPDLTRAIPHIS